MNIFYNPKGIGDVLLISLKPIDSKQRETIRHGDVAVLTHAATNETVGFHIFNASSYGEITGTGRIAADADHVQLINEALQENNIDSSLEVPAQSEFVVGYVTGKKQHPDADKLSVCEVDTGADTLQIVCGAPNVDKDQKVAVAVPGAVMPSGMKIKKSKLRGVTSTGMICSVSELALPEKQTEKGILVLGDAYETGQDFYKQYHERPVSASV